MQRPGSPDAAQGAAPQAPYWRDLITAESPRTPSREQTPPPADDYDDGLGAGHPEQVQDKDVSSIQKLIRSLEAMAAGALITTEGAKSKSSYLRDAFDKDGQRIPLNPDRVEPKVQLLHDRLNRLKSGGPEHRAIVRQFEQASRQAGRRKWDKTRDEMEAVQRASQAYLTPYEPKRKDVKKAVEERYGPAIAKTVHGVMLKSGVVKGATHSNSSAKGFRNRIDDLRRHRDRDRDERYAGPLERWERFDAAQQPLAQRAAQNQATIASSSRRPEKRAETVEDHIGRLERMARMEVGIRKTHIAGVTENASFRQYFDSEGGFTTKGETYLVKVQEKEGQEPARRLMQASASSVKAHRECTAAMLRRLTDIIGRIKNGADKQSFLNAIPDDTVENCEVRNALIYVVNAHGTSLLNAQQDTLNAFATKIARLEQTATEPQRQALAGFWDAMRQPHPLHRGQGPDPQAQLAPRLEQARARLRAPLPPRPPGHVAQAAAPRTTAAGPAGSSPSGHFSIPSSWPATPASPSTLELNAPPHEHEPDDEFASLPAAPSVGFLPPLSPTASTGATQRPSAQRVASAGPAGSDTSARFSIPWSLPPSPASLDMFDLNAPPAEDPTDDAFSSLPDLGTLPTLSPAATGGSARAAPAAGSSQARDFSLIDQAAARLPPAQRIILFDAFQELDGHLASLNQPHLEELLRGAPGHLAFLAGPQHAQTVQLLLELLNRPAAPR